jgi:hypothetical protein
MDGVMLAIDGRGNGLDGRPVRFRRRGYTQVEETIIQNWQFISIIFEADVTFSECNKSESFLASTKLALSNISSDCWLCGNDRYEVAHALGRVDTSVLLLPRT